MDVALASCAVLPEPDPDEELTVRAMRAAGIDARVLAWDDPAADFSAARISILRATWNYPELPDQFRAWIEKTAAVTRLWNPLPVLKWNLHKKYLLDLAAAGVPATPTHLVRRGSTECLADIMKARGWSDAVLKPAIASASRLILRVGKDTVEQGDAHLRAVAAKEDVLVQPYLPSVEDYGERALVWIDGELTHAVRKSPRFAGQDESVSGAVPISPAEADVARRALAVVEGPLLYARIDVAPGPDGQPMVMELELLEPSLFFLQSPAALDRFVRAVGQLLERP